MKTLGGADLLPQPPTPTHTIIEHVETLGGGDLPPSPPLPSYRLENVLSLGKDDPRRPRPSSRHREKPWRG